MCSTIYRKIIIFVHFHFRLTIDQTEQCRCRWTLNMSFLWSDDFGWHSNNLDRWDPNSKHRISNLFIVRKNVGQHTSDNNNFVFWDKAKKDHSSSTHIITEKRQSSCITIDHSEWNFTLYYVLYHSNSQQANGYDITIMIYIHICRYAICIISSKTTCIHVARLA